MTDIAPGQEPNGSSRLMPDIYPRLAYDDERAAVEYLARVFQLEEIRDARVEYGDMLLAWLRSGTGVIMVGRADEEVHQISSPGTRGGTTVQMMVNVDDIDTHYAHAVANGADISTPIEDAFYGERRYEAWLTPTGFEAEREVHEVRSCPPRRGSAPCKAPGSPMASRLRG
ncbi:MAG: VOC family protein, partial [Myxococcota bacterium]|nr:VOC family protein [Myxococcota bacterium]